MGLFVLLYHPLLMPYLVQFKRHYKMQNIKLGTLQNRYLNWIGLKVWFLIIHLNDPNCPNSRYLAKCMNWRTWHDYSIGFLLFILFAIHLEFGEVWCHIYCSNLHNFVLVICLVLVLGCKHITTMAIVS